MANAGQRSVLCCREIASAFVCFRRLRRAQELGRTRGSREIAGNLDNWPVIMFCRYPAEGDVEASGNLRLRLVACDRSNYTSNAAWTEAYQINVMADEAVSGFLSCWRASKCTYFPAILRFDFYDHQRSFVTVWISRLPRILPLRVLPRYGRIGSSSRPKPTESIAPWKSALAARRFAHHYLWPRHIFSKAELAQAAVNTATAECTARYEPSHPLGG